MTLRLAAQKLGSAARQLLVLTLIFAIGPTAPLLAQVSAISQSVASTPMSLHITILDGEDALNSIRERTAREPIVEVDDENHKPVAGALLLFSIQNGGTGAGGTFSGLNTLSVTTGADGRGIAHGLKPNQTSGSYTITVTATLGVLVATAIVHQTNAIVAAASSGAASGATTAATASGATTAGGTTGAIKTPATTSAPSTTSTFKVPRKIIHLGSKRFWIVGGTAVAVGVVVGVVVATHNGNSSTTITPGTGTVGP